MRDSNELLQLVCGVLAVETYAARHGLSVEEVIALRDGAATRLSKVLSPRPSSGRWMMALVAGLLLGLLPTGALAQLIPFLPDQPAKASEVNGNFNQLKDWLEQKVGSVTNAGITTGSVSATSLTVTHATTLQGPVTIAGTVGANTVNATTVNVTGTLTGNGSLNGVTLRIKTGNNGTVSCNQYCEGTFNGTVNSACIGARLPNGFITGDCTFAPGVGTPLICLCASF